MKADPRVPLPDPNVRGKVLKAPMIDRVGEDQNLFVRKHEIDFPD